MRSWLLLSLTLLSACRFEVKQPRSADESSNAAASLYSEATPSTPTEATVSKILPVFGEKTVTSAFVLTAGQILQVYKDGPNELMDPSFKQGLDPEPSVVLDMDMVGNSGFQIRQYASRAALICSTVDGATTLTDLPTAAGEKAYALRARVATFEATAEVIVLALHFLTSGKVEWFSVTPTCSNFSKLTNDPSPTDLEDLRTLPTPSQGMIGNQLGRIEEGRFWLGSRKPQTFLDLGLILGFWASGNSQTILTFLKPESILVSSLTEPSPTPSSTPEGPPTFILNTLGEIPLPKSKQPELTDLALEYTLQAIQEGVAFAMPKGPALATSGRYVLGSNPSTRNSFKLLNQRGLSSVSIVSASPGPSPSSSSQPKFCNIAATGAPIEGAAIVGGRDNQGCKNVSLDASITRSASPDCKEFCDSICAYVKMSGTACGAQAGGSEWSYYSGTSCNTQMPDFFDKPTQCNSPLTLTAGYTYQSGCKIGFSFNGQNASSDPLAPRPVEEKALGPCQRKNQGGGDESGGGTTASHEPDQEETRPTRANTAPTANCQLKGDCPRNWKDVAGFSPAPSCYIWMPSHHDMMISQALRGHIHPNTSYPPGQIVWDYPMVTPTTPLFAEKVSNPAITDNFAPYDSLRGMRDNVATGCNAPRVLPRVPSDIKDPTLAPDPSNPSKKLPNTLIFLPSKGSPLSSGGASAFYFPKPVGDKYALEETGKEQNSESGVFTLRISFPKESKFKLSKSFSGNLPLNAAMLKTVGQGTQYGVSATSKFGWPWINVFQTRNGSLGTRDKAAPTLPMRVSEWGSVLLTGIRVNRNASDIDPDYEYLPRDIRWSFKKTLSGTYDEATILATGDNSLNGPVGGLLDALPLCKVTAQGDPKGLGYNWDGLKLSGNCVAEPTLSIRAVTPEDRSASETGFVIEFRLNITRPDKPEEKDDLGNPVELSQLSYSLTHLNLTKILEHLMNQQIYGYFEDRLALPDTFDHTIEVKEGSRANATPYSLVLKRPSAILYQNAVNYSQNFQSFKNGIRVGTLDGNLQVNLPLMGAPTGEFPMDLGLTYNASTQNLFKNIFSYEDTYQTYRIKDGEFSSDPPIRRHFLDLRRIWRNHGPYGWEPTYHRWLGVLMPFGAGMHSPHTTQILLGFYTRPKDHTPLTDTDYIFKNDGSFTTTHLAIHPITRRRTAMLLGPQGELVPFMGTGDGKTQFTFGWGMPPHVLPPRYENVKLQGANPESDLNAPNLNLSNLNALGGAGTQNPLTIRVTNSTKANCYLELSLKTISGTEMIFKSPWTEAGKFYLKDGTTINSADGPCVQDEAAILSRTKNADLYPGLESTSNTLYGSQVTVSTFPDGNSQIEGHKGRINQKDQDWTLYDPHGREIFIKAKQFTINDPKYVARLNPFVAQEITFGPDKKLYVVLEGQNLSGAETLTISTNEALGSNLLKIEGPDTYPMGYKFSYSNDTKALTQFCDGIYDKLCFGFTYYDKELEKSSFLNRYELASLQEGIKPKWQFTRSFGSSTRLTPPLTVVTTNPLGAKVTDTFVSPETTPTLSLYQSGTRKTEIARDSDFSGSRTVETVFDRSTRVLSTKEGSRITKFTYDDSCGTGEACHDKPLKIELPGGDTTTFRYNTKNQKEQEVIQTGSTTRTTTYGYQSNGVKLDSISKPGPQLGSELLTRFTYNGLGFKTAITKPDNTQIITTYKPSNLPEEVKVSGGNLSLRLSKVLAYDAYGRPTRTQDATEQSLGETYFTETIYDSFNRILGTSRLVDATTLHRMENTYDENHLLSATNAFGGVTRYEYDSYRRLVSVTDTTGKVSTSSYDDLDRITSETNGLGGTIFHTYTKHSLPKASCLDQACTQKISETQYTDFDEVWKTTTYALIGGKEQKWESNLYYDISGRPTHKVLGPCSSKTAPCADGTYELTIYNGSLPETIRASTESGLVTTKRFSYSNTGYLTQEQSGFVDPSNPLTTRYTYDSSTGEIDTIFGPWAANSQGVTRVSGSDVSEPAQKNERDSLGRVIRTLYRGVEQERLQYHPINGLVTHRYRPVPQGQSGTPPPFELLTWDGLGRALQTKNSLGEVEEHQYLREDGFEKNTVITPNQVDSLTVDKAGLVVEESNSIRGATKHYYNKGLLTKTEYPCNLTSEDPSSSSCLDVMRTTSLHYDTFGRVISKSEPAIKSVNGSLAQLIITNRYDPRSGLLLSTNDGNTHTFEYDDLRAPIVTCTSHTGGLDGRVIATEYDTRLRKQSESLYKDSSCASKNSLIHKSQWQYTTGNQIHQTTDNYVGPNGETFLETHGFAYDPLGRSAGVQVATKQGSALLFEQATLNGYDGLNRQSFTQTYVSTPSHLMRTHRVETSFGGNSQIPVAQKYWLASGEGSSGSVWGFGSGDFTGFPNPQVIVPSLTAMGTVTRELSHTTFTYDAWSRLTDMKTLANTQTLGVGFIQKQLYHVGFNYDPNVRSRVTKRTLYHIDPRGLAYDAYTFTNGLLSKHTYNNPGTDATDGYTEELRYTSTGQIDKTTRSFQVYDNKLWSGQVVKDNTVTETKRIYDGNLTLPTRYQTLSTIERTPYVTNAQTTRVYETASTKLQYGSRGQVVSESTCKEAQENTCLSNEVSSWVTHSYDILGNIRAQTSGQNNTRILGAETTVLEKSQSSESTTFESGLTGVFYSSHNGFQITPQGQEKTLAYRTFLSGTATLAQIKNTSGIYDPWALETYLYGDHYAYNKKDLNVLPDPGFKTDTLGVADEKGFLVAKGHVGSPFLYGFYLTGMTQYDALKNAKVVDRHSGNLVACIQEANCIGFNANPSTDYRWAGYYYDSPSGLWFNGAWSGTLGRISGAAMGLAATAKMATYDAIHGIATLAKGGVQLARGNTAGVESLYYSASGGMQWAVNATRVSGFLANHLNTMSPWNLAYAGATVATTLGTFGHSALTNLARVTGSNMLLATARASQGMAQALDFLSGNLIQLRTALTSSGAKSRATILHNRKPHTPSPPEAPFGVLQAERDLFKVGTDAEHLGKGTFGIVVGVDENTALKFSNLESIRETFHRYNPFMHNTPRPLFEEIVAGVSEADMLSQKQVLEIMGQQPKIHKNLRYARPGEVVRVHNTVDNSFSHGLLMERLKGHSLHRWGVDYYWRFSSHKDALVAQLKRIFPKNTSKVVADIEARNVIYIGPDFHVPNIEEIPVDYIVDMFLERGELVIADPTVFDMHGFAQEQLLRAD